MHTDGKESHAIVMKAQIQSGDVSNPKNIEESTESARTGNHESSARTISIAYVQFFVPGISQVPSGQFQLLPYTSSYRGNQTFLTDKCMEIIMKCFQEGLNAIVF